MLEIKTKIYPAPPINLREVLRYAGVGTADGTTLSLIQDCIKEAEPHLSFRVCCAEISRSSEYAPLIFGMAGTGEYLSKSEGAVIFVATVGIEIDRLIAKYSRISASKALLIQAIGAQRIEALCDVFSREYSDELLGRGYKALRRISPGYGSFGLEAQRELFSILELNKRIGLSLNDSLIMSPSKSVTAIFGFEKL